MLSVVGCTAQLNPVLLQAMEKLLVVGKGSRALLAVKAETQSGSSGEVEVWSKGDRSMLPGDSKLLLCSKMSRALLGALCVNRHGGPEAELHCISLQ